MQQITDFVQTAVAEPEVILAGNSLGGYLAVLATVRSKKVKGVMLMNATPFWGWIPNESKRLRA